MTMTPYVGNVKVGECPACQTGNLRLVLKFTHKDFDGSIFNMEVNFGFCDQCNFVRVLVPFDDAKIAEHYTGQSLYGSLGGVGVGGSSREDIIRYSYYAKLLHEMTEKPGSIADVGCASGGLLKYLRQKCGYKKRLTGIDIDTRLLASLHECEMDVVQGNALDLKVAESSFDFVFYTHILEHILDIDRAIEEMKRIVADGGYVLIEVPDASRYAEARIHDYYWIGMREHVNHFTPASLCSILNRHGVVIQSVHRRQLPMKGGSFYPSLIVLGEIIKNRKVREVLIESESPDWFSDHIESETRFAERTKSNLEAFCCGDNDLIVWGVGLEFFNLLALEVLSVNNDSILLDSNLAKQERTVAGCQILDPRKVCCESGKRLLCTSSMSWQQVVQQACSLGFDRRRILCI